MKTLAFIMAFIGLVMAISNRDHLRSIAAEGVRMCETIGGTATTHSDGAQFTCVLKRK